MTGVMLGSVKSALSRSGLKTLHELVDFHDVSVDKKSADILYFQILLYQ